MLQPVYTALGLTDTPGRGIHLPKLDFSSIRHGLTHQPAVVRVGAEHGGFFEVMGGTAFNRRNCVSEVGFDGIKSAPLPGSGLGARLRHTLDKSLVVFKPVIKPGIFVGKPDDDRRRTTMPCHQDLLSAGFVHELR